MTAHRARSEPVHRAPVAIVAPHGPESLDITDAMNIPTGIRKDKNVTASALFGVAVIQMLRGAFGWLLYGGEYGLAEGFIIFNGGIFVALGIAARWVRVLAALSGAVLYVVYLALQASSVLRLTSVFFEVPVVAFLLVAVVFALKHSVAEPRV